MARIKNTDRYTIKTNPVGDDTVVINDSGDNGKTRSVKLSSIVDLAQGGGTDTFAVLNGNLITFPDGQQVDVTPVIDTDTDTFATLDNTVITFAEGDTVDIRQGNAVINGNIITFGDGQTRDITPVIDTDTDTFATLSGGTITFADGQTIAIPSGGTDDQTALEVSIQAITGIAASEVQTALEQIFGAVPTNTSGLINDGSNGSDPFITGLTLPSYSLSYSGDTLSLLRNGASISSVTISGGSVTVDATLNSASTNPVRNSTATNTISLVNNSSLRNTFFTNSTARYDSTARADASEVTYDQDIIIAEIGGTNYQLTRRNSVDIKDQILPYVLDNAGREFFVGVFIQRAAANYALLTPESFEYILISGGVALTGLDANYTANEINYVIPASPGFVLNFNDDSRVGFTFTLSDINSGITGLTDTYQVAESGDVYEYVYQNGLLISRTLQAT